MSELDFNKIWGKVEPDVKENQDTQLDFESIWGIKEQPAVQPEPESYNISNLTEDRFYDDIYTYMADLQGTHLNYDDRDDVVSKFVNHRRGVEGGNSYRVLKELNYVSSLDDSEKEKVTRAYKIWDNLPNAFVGEDVTWMGSESVFGDDGRLGATIDYVRSAVLDPANLVGGLAGKVVTSGGIKGSSMVANRAANKMVQKQLANGASREAAEQAGQRTYKIFSNKIAAQGAVRSAERQVAVNKAKGLLLSKPGMKEFGTIAAIDGAIGVAVDAAYQNTVIDLGLQEQFNFGQSALVGATALASGYAIARVGEGISRSRNLSGKTGVGPSLMDVKTERTGLDTSKTLNALADAIDNDRIIPRNPGVERGDWVTDIRGARNVDDIPAQLYVKMLEGDEDLGVNGLINDLLDQNFYFVKQSDSDTISNYLGDILKGMDEGELQDFLGAINPDLSDVTPKEFGNKFKSNVSIANVLNNRLSQASKNLMINDYRELIGPALWDNSFGKAGELNVSQSRLEKFFQGRFKGMKRVSNTQNQMIRGMVSNLATTQLNLLGWSVSTTLDSVTDIVRSYGNVVMSALIDPYNFTQSIRDAGVATSSPIRKLANTVDANMTLDMFNSYAAVRPGAVKELTDVLVSGVEDMKSNFNPDMTITGRMTDEFINAAQNLALVRGQDSITKSVEFITAMDDSLRRVYGKSYGEFFDSTKNPEYWKTMDSPEFAKLERDAVLKALDNTFSRGYSRDKGLGEIAAIIENARNIPLVGIAVPFGRFFNNTMAFMADYSGLGLAMKMAGESTESVQTKLSRAAVGWSTVAALTAYEDKYIDMGLNWDEQTQFGDVTGEITSEQNNFPYVFFKGMARWISLGKAVEEGRISPEAAALQRGEIQATLLTDPLVRGLEDLTGGLEDFIKQLSNTEESEFNSIMEAAGAIVQNVAKTITRAVEPVDAMVGIAKGSDRLVPDRRQGNSVFNETTRYMENIISTISGRPLEEQRYSATRGAVRPQDSKFIAPARSVPVTNLSRLAALTGVREWDEKMVNIGKQFPEGSNRYAELFSRLAEVRAGKLLNSKRWKDADPAYREILRDEVLQTSRKVVTQIMESDLGDGDAALARIIAMKKTYGETKVEGAMRDMGIEGDIGDLDAEQIYLLEDMLKYRKEIIEMNNR